MERGVDLHGLGQTETDCSRVDHYGDGEGANNDRSQFPGPEPLSREVSGWSVALVGTLVATRGAEEYGPGPHPSAPTIMNKSLDSGDTGLPLLFREEWRLIAALEPWQNWNGDRPVDSWEGCCVHTLPTAVVWTRR